MEGVEFLDKGIEGVEGGLACVVVVEISVFIQGPVYLCVEHVLAFHLWLL